MSQHRLTGVSTNDHSHADEAHHSYGLQPLGWDDGWATTLADALATLDPAADDPAVRVGRVSRADRSVCDVLVAPPSPTPLRVLGGLRWSGALGRAAAADPSAAPAAGDWVILESAGHGGADHDWVVTRVLPRRTAVHRAEVTPGSSRAQVVAANPDVVAVVEPLPGVAGRIERLVALAWASGARPLLVLTKADLEPDPAGRAAWARDLAPGVEVLTVATLDGEGLEPLRTELARGATIALVGASGVGKSTLLNALVGDGAQVMRTQAVREDGKGRHTTVTRELHPGPHGGAVLDTPGMRTIGLSGSEDLEDVFPEIEELAAACRFGDCAHRTEPGCAVLAAVASGDLPDRRLASYRALEREALNRAARTDARLRAAQVAELKARQRSYRNRPDVSGGRGSRQR